MKRRNAGTQGLEIALLRDEERNMGHQEIKDRFGNVRAIIREQPGGWAEMFQVTGAFMGRYDPCLEQTFDRHGGLVGAGNQLMTLIGDGDGEVLNVGFASVFEKRGMQ